LAFHFLLQVRGDSGGTAARHRPRGRVGRRRAGIRFEAGKKNNDQSQFDAAVYFDKTVAKKIGDHFRAKVAAAKDPDDKIERLELVARFDNSFTEELKINKKAQGRIYLDLAKKTAVIPGQEELTKKYKDKARAYLGEAVVEEAPAETAVEEVAEEAPTEADAETDTPAEAEAEAETEPVTEADDDTVDAKDEEE